MGDYSRSTKVVLFEDISPNVMQGTQKYVKLHNLRSILNDISLCIVSTSEKVKKRMFGVLVAIVVATSLACLSSSLVSSVKASDPKVGVEFLEDGRVVEKAEISSDVTQIYFEFFLDIPEGAEADLTVRWFFQDQLLQAYSGKLPRGYHLATLDRDVNVIPSFETGKYYVELWFLNTLILSDDFSIVE